jgi:hypothetical protein
MRWRQLGIAAVVALVAIQLVPVDRSNPAVGETVPMTPAVEPILHRACFDCHSHETRWPWYAWVAPVSWLVADDVHQARRHLNFSTWDAYTQKKRSKKLDELLEQVHEGDMPLWYYRLVHRSAVLSSDDVDAIEAWTGTLLATPRN